MGDCWRTVDEDGAAMTHPITYHKRAFRKSTDGWIIKVVRTRIGDFDFRTIKAAMAGFDEYDSTRFLRSWVREYDSKIIINGAHAFDTTTTLVTVLFKMSNADFFKYRLRYGDE